MTLLEKAWFFISITINLIILFTDPKNPTSTGTLGNQISTAFASVSDSQRFINRLNGLFIALFFLLTLGLSYGN